MAVATEQKAATHIPPLKCRKCIQFVLAYDGEPCRCDRGVDINNPETATEIGTGGCALYERAYQCTYCGILIGANHAMKDAHPIHGKYACGLCYEDYRRNPVAFIRNAGQSIGEATGQPGRPRLPSIDDLLIRQQQPSRALVFEKEGCDILASLPHRLNELRALWKLQSLRSRGDIKTEAEADLGRESVSAEGKK